MNRDENPYSPPKPRESPRTGKQAPRKLFSFALLLELFVLLAVVMTLLSLLAPHLR